MPKVKLWQEVKMTLDDVPAEYQRYDLTIPAKIVRETHLLHRPIMYARVSSGRIILEHERVTYSDIEVHVMHKRTNTINGRDYHTTHITIPAKLARQLHLKGGQELDIIHDRDRLVISRHKTRK